MSTTCLNLSFLSVSISWAYAGITKDLHHSKLFRAQLSTGNKAGWILLLDMFVWSATESGVLREFYYSELGHADGTWTERWEAEQDKRSCCRASAEFSVRVKGGRAEGAFLTSLVWISWKPEGTLANRCFSWWTGQPTNDCVTNILVKFYSTSLKQKHTRCPSIGQ